MNEARVEVGGWLMRIGNGWQHLQVLLNAMSCEMDAAIMPVLLHMLKSCRSLLYTPLCAAAAAAAALYSMAGPYLQASSRCRLHDPCICKAGRMEATLHKNQCISETTQGVSSTMVMSHVHIPATASHMVRQGPLCACCRRTTGLRNCGTRPSTDCKKPNAEIYLATDGCIVFSPSTCPSCLGPSGLVASALLMYELVYIAMVRNCVL